MPYSSTTFVKEQDEKNGPYCHEVALQEALTGKEAREFYESIVNQEESIKKETSVKKRKKVITQESRKHFKNGDIFKLAQNNNAEELTCLLRQNKDLCIDAVDAFGWTALMCASCSGAQEAAKLLLDNGANMTVLDKIGNSALSLAKKYKHRNIVHMLENHDSNKRNQNVQHLVPQSTEEFFCEVCNNKFNDDNRHESSTLHLFSSSDIQLKTFYGIPESNKGFQMLLKKGWNREKGLGLKESGIKFPIKIKRKNDRSGIGVIKSEAQEKRNNKILRDRSMYFYFQTMEDPKKSLKYLEELESLGEEILRDRREIIALDKQRNETREGLRALQKMTEKKSWMAVGPLLVKIKKEVAQDILKSDQVKFDAEINKIRSNLKVKVNNLRDMEYQPPVPGLTLNAMTHSEMNAIGQVLGRHAD